MGAAEHNLKHTPAPRAAGNHRLVPVWILCCIALLFATPLLPQYRFTNLTVKQGLPTNKVYHSARDARGFLWFATDNGLCRYDGARFYRFTHNATDTNSIGEFIISAVYPLGYDELLLLTGKGKLYTYSYRSGAFRLLSKQQPWIERYSITSFFTDRKGNYWFTTSRGLVAARKDFAFIKEYIIPDTVKGHHLANQVNSICEDGSGIFWLAMFYRGVVRFNPASGVFDTKGTAAFIPHVQVHEIVTRPGSRLVYIPTGGDGLFTVDIYTLRYTRMRQQQGGLPTEILTCAAFENDSVLWVGSLEGLSRINVRTKTVTNYQHNPDHPYSLANNIVQSVAYDSTGVLWVNTFGGISKLQTAAGRFTKLCAGEESGLLSSNKVIGCYADKWNNLWVATSKGIDVFTADMRRSAHYALPKSFMYHENDEVVRFYEDRQGNFWIGTWGGGISRTRLPERFSPGMGLRFTNFYYDSTNTGSLGSNFIRSFAEDAYGNLWITTWNGGISITPREQLRAEQIAFKHLTAGKDSTRSLASNYVHEILPGAGTDFWICTAMGLQRYDYGKGSCELFYPEPGGLDVPINSTTHIVKDAGGNIWHGTFGGLVKLTRQDNGKYTQRVIYKDNYRGIYSLAADTNGTLWFTTLNSEIGSYNPVTGMLRFYSMTDEVNGCDFYFGFPCVNARGDMFFPSFSGLFYFNPARVVSNSTEPALYITGIAVAGIAYRAEADITTIHAITIDHDFGSLKVSAAALNYIYPEQNEYSYLLEGYSKSWTRLGNTGEVFFAGLPPGTYTLKIRGSNNDGVWGKEPVQLSILIRPPFYRNSYFIGIVLLLLLVGTGTLVHRKFRNLRVEKQQQLVFSKLLITSQEAERKRLSNELHDSLGQNLLVIKNLLHLYSAAPQKDEADLESIAELIKDSIAEVKEISSNLHPHQLERLGLKKALAAMLGKSEKASGIPISHTIDDCTGLLTPDAEINIYRIVQESVNNIIKHSGATRAEVWLRLNGNRLLLRVEDNGAGIAFDSKELQQRFTDGLGLKSMRERARLAGGELSFTTAEGGGTALLLELQLPKTTTGATDGTT